MVYNDSFSSDDEEEQCPLCIEDMDVTDKSFKPCPCGFQICQFCYNNIRSGPEQYNRCPACRRPYDDKSIEYSMVTPEDLKREQERKQRKEQERKQREREKNKEQSHHALHGARDKKHLANMRVIQKNLVYVIGLNPNIPSEELQQMLRRDEFFGQYGKIQKIVINKRVNGNGHPGVGVYVTFARKEDAARCIAAVDGSVNDGKYLRAAYGTTKYCSSYLRGQNCPNPNCMFLHEPGEEADSFNRHHPQSTQGQQQHPPQSILGGLPPSHQPSPQPSLLGHHPPLGHSAVSSTATSPIAAAQTPFLTTPSRVATPAQATPVSSAGSAGTGILAAAQAPALPAWGKAVPQIPPVQKISEPFTTAATHEVLQRLTQCLTTLGSSNDWSVVFVNNSESEKFPAMFSLPMDDKRRLKAYKKAVADLDKLAERHRRTDDADPASRAQSQAPSTAQSSPVPASAGSVPPGMLLPNSAQPAAGSKKNNSQQLLAQLMREKQPGSGPNEGVYSY